MSTQDALWSAQEVRTQAEQCAGQLDIWQCVASLVCGCGAYDGPDSDMFERVTHSTACGQASADVSGATNGGTQ
jgi:hypothetical protein